MTSAAEQSPVSHSITRTYPQPSVIHCSGPADGKDQRIAALERENSDLRTMLHRARMEVLDIRNKKP